MTDSPLLRKNPSVECPDALLTVEQRTESDLQHAGDLLKRKQRDVVFASFNARDEREVEIRSIGNVLLRHLLSFTSCLDLAADMP